MKYLHKELGIYEVIEPLSANYSVGMTLDDLKNGMFIVLTDEQIEYATLHPDSTVYEIFNMAVQSVPLAFLKHKKIVEIEEYDKSESVNCFSVNGFSMWLDRNTRSSLMTTLSAYKAYSLDEITLWTEGNNPIPITLSIENMEDLLVSLEMYAKACFDTTAMHKAKVQQLFTKEEIEDYDFTFGYPEKLSLTL